MTKIYLAGPLFTLAEQRFNADLARLLESEGFEVWLPQEHEPRSDTARAIFDMDVEALDAAIPTAARPGSAATPMPRASRSSATGRISASPATPPALRTI
jgi:hypothetical protein